MRPVLLAVLLASFLPFANAPGVSAQSQCWNWWGCDSTNDRDDDRRNNNNNNNNNNRGRNGYASELRSDLRELQVDLRRHDLSEFREDLADMLEDLRRSDRREVRDEVRAIRRALQRNDMDALREAFQDLRRELRDETQGNRGNSWWNDWSSSNSSCPDGYRLVSSTSTTLTCVRN